MPSPWPSLSAAFAPPSSISTTFTQRGTIRQPIASPKRADQLNRGRTMLPRTDCQSRDGCLLILRARKTEQEGQMEGRFLMRRAGKMGPAGRDEVRGGRARRGRRRQTDTVFDGGSISVGMFSPLLLLGFAVASLHLIYH
ncbi:hypothetical protein FA13DRAFT_352000 [Coprinellus micaceus]|uniref:Uncharacterized protein n=1 Tax=Coprinellus micaceus TaxID=71717 RepID=A0A4Y7TAL3_COPMI|nr:hypothetical protein FA13DRAFT_352000 [Coprinellus micaceus]